MGRSILLTAVAVLLAAVPTAHAAIAPVSLCVGVVQMIERGDLSTQGPSLQPDQTVEAALPVDLRADAASAVAMGYRPGYRPGYLPEYRPGYPPEYRQGRDRSYGAGSAGSDPYYYPRRYRAPRYRPYGRSYMPPIVTQLGIGFYDPSGPPEKSFLLDARVGPQIDPNVQLGLMVDWAHRADRASSTFGGETVGGVDLSFQDSRLRGRTDLIPMLGFIQVGGNDQDRPSPYAGFGAGYEILSMEADQPDGSRFEGTFGGWGWQGWIGGAVPLSYQARLIGEVFYNRVDLGRDVVVDGRTLRQTADFNGPGMRFGLAWGF